MSASDTQTTVITNLKCDVGNIEGSLCSWIQLKGVNVPLVSIGMN